MFPATTADILEIGPETRFNYLHHVVELEGEIPRAVLERALVRAVAAWPVLGCRFEDRRTAGGWEPLEGFHVSSLLREDRADSTESLEEQTSQFMLDAPSVRSGAPLRLLSLRHDGGTRLVLKLHHGASDAMGGIELLRLIGAAISGVPWDGPETGARRIGELVANEQRGRRADVVRSVMKQLPPWAKAVSLSRHTPPIGRPGPGPIRPALLQSTLDAKQTRAVLERSKTGVSVAASLTAAALVATFDRCRVEGHAPKELGVFFTIDSRRHFAGSGRTLANLTSAHILAVPCDELTTFERAVAAVNAAITETMSTGYAGVAPMLIADTIGPALPTRVMRALADGPPYLPFVYVAYMGNVDPMLATFGPRLRNYLLFPSPAPAYASPPLFATLARDRLSFALYYDQRSCSLPAATRFRDDVERLMCDESRSRDATRTLQ